jgi:hypothetical protein
MSQKKFKVGDLVEYTRKDYFGIKGIGIVYAIHDVTDGIYDTQQRLVYEILSQTEEGMPIFGGAFLKKIS